MASYAMRQRPQAPQIKKISPPAKEQQMRQGNEEMEGENEKFLRKIFMLLAVDLDSST
jgi:hypothetical protein